ncbi:FAD/NADP-binding domain-containing protein [Dacryopinax primogenitus]|uniref:FAD/NADP-binding domain-containing protein n=1 Tax=Dacryopinax primogenitus (strain DJM 731) TaxID=1858805 RepID=M5FWN6_DACPD|nr:FAD/NADP-binding domain-containing protein [Dacryopinax primogenitus]EJU00804.1 FAD/NADP-binding domain-containing protein [Dacryopinax primogenitus]
MSLSRCLRLSSSFAQSVSPSRHIAVTRHFATTQVWAQAQQPRSNAPLYLRRTFLIFKWSAYLVASTAVGLLTTGAVILGHDALTYSSKHVDRVPVSPLALRPETGGPKNLPIASILVDDEEDEENKKIALKPRLVIVGGGWGAMSLLKTLHPGDYHVTVIAPDTFTWFTPLLPSAAVGTVQVRSLIEPIRKIVARVHGHFITGKAVDCALGERLLEVETTLPDGMKRSLYVPYDKLIIACGSVSSTHGVPGLENCFQLKTIADAQAIRRRILDNFETASLPTTSPEERKRLLSFVICGGGPTGVETAAEIYDLCQEDIMNYYPKLCREEVSISIIQSRDHILNTYTEHISNYAEEKFRRDEVKLIVNGRVKSVHPGKVLYDEKDPSGQVSTHEIPAGFVLWSTGIAMNPFVERMVALLPNQVHKKAIEVDAHLRVKGAPGIYAIGDASTIETSLVRHVLDLADQCDVNHDGQIDFNEWQVMVAKIKQKVPLAEAHLQHLREIFDAFDSDRDDRLGLNELTALLQDISSKITTLPATAQVAAQQGKYIGRKFNYLAKHEQTLVQNQIIDFDEAFFRPFRYMHLGSLAYVGNAAVFDFGSTSFAGGLIAMYAWRSIYWSESVSARTRALLLFDWIIRGIWGRDLSRL